METRELNPRLPSCFHWSICARRKICSQATSNRSRRKTIPAIIDQSHDLSPTASRNRKMMTNGTALALPLKRSPTILRPDPSRVLLRQFDPGDAQRMSGIIERILTIPEAKVGPLLDQVYADFAQRHLN